MKILIIKRAHPIKFFFKTKDVFILDNWRFIIHFNRWNKKPFVKLHILIRTPFFCLERNNGGTQIGNKHIIWFVR